MELLDEIFGRSERPADGVANAFFRARRFIGSGDRRAVSDRAWSILRHYGQLTWWLDKTRHPERGARAIVSADLMLQDGLTFQQLEAMFDGGSYRPGPRDDGERRALRPMGGP
jgi:16S rRNA (cytosine967-C5)-methyltransferase